jgi:hypothetical protein
VACPSSSSGKAVLKSSKVGVTAVSVGGLAGGFKVTFGGVLVSCNHSGVVEKRVRLVAGGSCCGASVVNGGFAWVLPSR